MALVAELVGSIALLLWGLRLVRTGVMRAYGSTLKQLARNAEGRFLLAFSSGMFVAILLQSSTATALIVSSFSGQGFLSVTNAFIAILGADVGTAIAVFVASQKITWISPVFISIGVFGFLSTDNSKKRSLFRAVLGLGLILLALSIISKTATGLSRVEDFNVVMGVFVTKPFLMLALAVVLTYLAHSSLAIVLLGVGFVQSGFLSLDAGLFLVLGANIGTGLLPVVTSWGGVRDARIPVTANLMARILGVALIFPFVTHISGFMSSYLPASSIPAVLHLGLNIAVAALGLSLLPVLLRISTEILPVDVKNGNLVEPKHLDEGALGSTKVALACAKREALHMAEIAQSMVRNVLPVLQYDNEELRKEVVRQDDSLDLLFNATKFYIAKIMQNKLNEDESQRAIDLLSFTANMEHIGDIVDGSLMELAAKKAKQHVRFSGEGMAEIASLHEAICATFELAVNTFVSGDPDLARSLYSEKANVRKIEVKSVATHLERIGAGVLESVQSSGIHLDVIRDLKRINSHLTSIAYPVLIASGEVPKTKWKRPR